MSNYIKEMRELIGNIPLLLVACSVIVEDKHGRILLQHRSDTLNYGTPGGCLELNETLLDGAKRELEETGLQLTNMSLFGLYSGEKCITNYPNGDVCHFVVVVFYTKLLHDVDLCLDNESLSLDFYDKNDLPLNIKASDNHWIDKWKNNDFAVVVD